MTNLLHRVDLVVPEFLKEYVSYWSCYYALQMPPFFSDVPTSFLAQHAIYCLAVEQYREIEMLIKKLLDTSLYKGFNTTEGVWQLT